MSCAELFGSISNLQWIPTKTASVSIIFSGTLKKVDVILKVTFKPLNSLDNSLQIEEQIYKNIVTNLLNNNHTPHLVKYINSINNCNFNLDEINVFNKE